MNLGCDTSCGRITWRSVKTFLLCLGGLLFAFSRSSAITDEDVFRQFKFNFNNPGARSLAMGGAFTSLANDASAVEANPAGLTQMLSSQFFAEFRNTRQEDSSMAGVARPEDSLEPGALIFSVSTNPQSSVTPSFISYLHPWRRISWAMSRHEVLNDSRVASVTNNLIPKSVALTFDSSSEGALEMKLVNWTASMGGRLTDHLRLGLTISAAELTVLSRIRNEIQIDWKELHDSVIQGLPIEGYRTSIDGSSWGMAWTTGALVSLPKGLTIGASYHRGSTHTLDETLIVNSYPSTAACDPASQPHPNDCDAIHALGDFLQTFIAGQGGGDLGASNTLHFTYELVVPDVWNLGVSWRIAKGLTFAMDATRTKYSNLMKGFHSGLNVLSIRASFTPIQVTPLQEPTMNDGTDLHVGTEYVLTFGAKATVIALRAGYWKESYGGLVEDVPCELCEVDSSVRPRPSFFPDAGAVNHFSLGTGLVFSNNFQMDIALDQSERSREVVTAFIYKF